MYKESHAHAVGKKICSATEQPPRSSHGHAIVKSLFQISYVVALITSVFTISTLSQNPVASRGEQLLSINQNECMSRARTALEAEGYRFLTGGTYSSIFGGKSVHTAGILCNAAPDGKIWVNIVVASVHNDMNVPGRERVRLQERMDPPAAGPLSCGLGKGWKVVESGHSSTWTRRGTSNIFDVSATIGGAAFRAEQSIEIQGNRIAIRRYSASDNNLCNFTGEIGADGKVAGTYSCTRFQPSSGWTATIMCN